MGSNILEVDIKSVDAPNIQSVTLGFNTLKINSHLRNALDALPGIRNTS